MKGFGKELIGNRRDLSSSSRKKVELALAMHAQGNIKQAIIEYKQIISSGLEDPRVYSALGLISLKNSEIKQAIKYNLKSIDINPQYIHGYLNLGVIFFQIGNYDEAEKHTKQAIMINPKSTQAYLNLGEILLKKLELSQAKKEIRKAISLDKKLVIAYHMLSKILIEDEDYLEAEKVLKEVISISPKIPNSYFLLHELYLQSGYLNKAKKFLYKTIEIDSGFALAYYSLSRFSNSKKDEDLFDKLFKIDTKEIKSIKDKINIFFAKANILHKRKLYKKSAHFLKKANKLKLSIFKSSANELIQIANENLIKTKELKADQNKTSKENQECIFIIGMPRSGSTLIESILNSNKNVTDLGERPLIEMSLKRTLSNNQNSKGYKSFYKVYLEERSKFVKSNNITTDKYLYNYLYLGNILNSFPYAKVIHSFRHPLDNILSIYKANFFDGVRFSSSIEDCALVYVDHIKTIKEYQKRFPSKIYSLNYDLLVTNPDLEIRKLIKWLNWEWDDVYLYPQDANRNIKTASVLQARSPINSKSLGGWEKYRDLLKPASNLLKENNLID